jgi:hypothetical protein
MHFTPFMSSRSRSMSEPNRTLSRRDLMTTSGAITALAIMGGEVKADLADQARAERPHGEGVSSDRADIEQFLKVDLKGSVVFSGFAEPWKAGDCEMRSITVTFFEDGHGEFRSKVKTTHTHSKDIWHVSIFIYDRNGLPLFNHGEFDGPQMAQGPTYDMVHTFYFQQYIYSYIFRCRLTGSC